MSEEERKDELPEEEPQIVPPEEELGERLTDQAESVTSGLSDLGDELTPRREDAPSVGESLPSLEEPLPAEGEPLPDEEPVWAPTEAVLPEGSTEPVEPAFAEEPPAAPLAAALAPVTPVGEQARAGTTFTPEGTDDDRLMAALAWFTMVILQLPIVSIIQLLSANTKDRPFQRHHAITSLLFYAAAFVYEILAAIVFTVLGVVTLGCGFACLWVLFLVPHILGLYYAFQAYSGKRIRLPGLTDFAKQQGWL
jgi:uncharacterized membrane protein